MKFQVETITPDKAKKYLEKNVHNRKLKPALVDRIARAIVNDEWKLNGEAIKFDTEGRLLDGQNRLSAIVAADKPVITFVVRGLPAQAQETMDLGRSRTLADMIQLRGEPNAMSVAATINLLYRWETGNIWNNARSNPTHGQALKFLDENRDKLDEAIREARSISDKLGRLLPMSMVAACWYVFSEIDAEDCTDFWTGVADGVHINGESVKNNESVFVLRSYLFRNQRVGRRTTRLEALHAIVVKAWNYYREGRPIKLLAWKGGGANPEPFPKAI